MKKIFIIPILAAAVAFSGFSFIIRSVDKEEAKKGFDYINKIRKDPAAHSKEVGVDLGSVQKMPVLKWNDTLAKVAEAKALDMAKRRYFGHTDPDGNGMNIKIHKAGYKLRESWIRNKDENMFESISAGNENCVEAIKALIVDEGTDPPNHRKHLLGMDPFWGECYDIGIGYVTDPSSEYRTYTCILIAKHK